MGTAGRIQCRLWAALMRNHVCNFRYSSYFVVAHKCISAFTLFGSHWSALAFLQVFLSHVKILLSLEINSFCVKMSRPYRRVLQLVLHSFIPRSCCFMHYEFWPFIFASSPCLTQCFIKNLHIM